MQAWVSKAVADALSQIDGRENTKKGSQDLNAGKAPEAEGSVPKENSPDAEGSQASKSSGSELLSRKEYAVLQREKFESFQAKARNRTADEAVTADALKVAGPLAMLTTPPIPYFSECRKLPHMGCFSPSQKGKELEFSPNSNGRRVANF